MLSSRGWGACTQQTGPVAHLSRHESGGRRGRCCRSRPIPIRLRLRCVRFERYERTQALSPFSVLRSIAPNRRSPPKWLTDTSRRAAREVPLQRHLHLTTAVGQVGRATRAWSLPDVRVDDGCASGFPAATSRSPALPEVPCDAGAALGDLDIGFPTLVDLELAGRLVWPDLRSVSGDVLAAFRRQ